MDSNIQEEVKEGYKETTTGRAKVKTILSGTTLQMDCMGGQ